MTAHDVIANDQRYILQTYQRPDFVIERGEGCYLFDTDGRRYLDCVAGIAVILLLTIGICIFDKKFIRDYQTL